MPATPSEEGLLAVVLSGAAARGAFQAGVLAELLPVLEEERTHPSILLGTSAGAINTALWAGTAHRGARAAADHLLETWQRIGHADVYRPLFLTGLRTATQFAAGAFLGRGSGMESLLDTEPLRRTALSLFDGDQIAANVDAGVFSSVGVMATRVPPLDLALETGAAARSVMFLDEAHPSDYAGDPEHGHDVVRCRLRTEHVLASAALPVAFPAQMVEQPPEAAGWYLDGGVRHNTPLRPAIAMGARRIIIVSVTPGAFGSSPLPPEVGKAAPDLAESSAHVLMTMLSDSEMEDVLTVRRTNRMVQQARESNPPTVLRRPDGSAYETVRFRTISPSPGELGKLAVQAADTRLRGAHALRNLDNLLLRRALRGAGTDAGQEALLSYFLFDEEYFALSIEHGRQAARAALEGDWET